jgi:hypothetical protein
MSIMCRFCRSGCGDLVLDLGRQPLTEPFPKDGEDAPDPRYPLRMWLCNDCRLAQLAGNVAIPAQANRAEPADLVPRQATLGR